LEDKMFEVKRNRICLFKAENEVYNDVMDKFSNEKRAHSTNFNGSNNGRKSLFTIRRN
tara:strand:+ start:2151 stop:2324 length:174 start_codon:yes stop_codon:yes gene_type:complete